MTHPTLTTVGLLAGLAAAAVAAPVPKDKPLPPPTPEQWEQSANNLKQIGLALHNYHDVNGAFPNNSFGPNGEPLLSWRVHLLPYIAEENPHIQFRLHEPWDSEHNKKLIEKMPKVYAPIRVTAKPGETFYRGFDGPGTAFERKKEVRTASFTDGMSNTAMVVEAGEPVIWTKPNDLLFDPDKNLPKLGGLFDGAFNILLGDASVQQVRKDFDVKTLKRVIQINDGFPVNFDELQPQK